MERIHVRFCTHLSTKVFQRRLDGSVNFNRNWSEYREGFGSLHGEFWLGNEALRLLTDVDGGSNWTIQVNLTDDNGKQGSLTKSPFRITGDMYTIGIGSSGDGPIGKTLSRVLQ